MSRGMLQCNQAFINERYVRVRRTPMSKQLTLSATLCVFAMALFALAGDKSPPSGIDQRGPAPFAIGATIAN